MPLMKPEIQAVLRKAGLGAESHPEKESLGEMLEQAGLSMFDTLENLATIANSSSNEGLRLRANETSLKLHGALKENAGQTIPSFTIVIQDAGASLNTIGAENPIFLPRQLIKELMEPKEPQPS